MLFILMGLAALGYFLSTFVAFGVQWMYYQMYVYSGFDPIGAVFQEIEQDEKNLEKLAEQQLFHK